MFLHMISTPKDGIGQSCDPLLSNGGQMETTVVLEIFVVINSSRSNETPKMKSSKISFEGVFNTGDIYGLFKS